MCNASPAVGIPAAALFMPYRDMGTKNALVIIFSTEEFQTMVQTNPTGVNYVVGWDGSLIVHPDFELVKMGANFSDRELVKKVLSSPSDNLQIRYRDLDGKQYLGAFRKLPVGALTVTSSTPTALVYKAATDVLRRNLYLTGVVTAPFDPRGLVFFQVGVATRAQARRRVAQNRGRGIRA